MSYNIETIVTLRISDDFRIPWALVRELRLDAGYDDEEDAAPLAYLDLDGSDLPECNFIQDLDPADAEDEDEWALLTDGLEWYGEGSGRAYDELFEDILRRTRGTFEGYVTWEDGALTGLRVVNGVVTHPDVVVSLED